jgi:hypothetical protein
MTSAQVRELVEPYVKKALPSGWITKDTVWAVVLFLPLAPAITYFSRVLWIYLDQAFDPEPPTGEAPRAT